MSSTPLPQRSSDVQVAEQPSPESVLPSSHASPGSTRALPHAPDTHTPSMHTPAPDERAHTVSSSAPVHVVRSSAAAQYGVPATNTHSVSRGQASVPHT